MIWDGSGLPFMEDGDDLAACATMLAGSYADEFAIHQSLTPDTVEDAALAGFMPMASAISCQNGTCEFLTPKLHLERSLLDPFLVHISATVRRESKKYSFSLNRAFDVVLDSCVQTHGDGWLSDGLVHSFRQLHAERTTRTVKFLSVELWKLNNDGASPVAGEIGYMIGRSYASLTGFSRVSGAGTVQLQTLGAWLAQAGIRVWDLGMELEYKLKLGARIVPRGRFLPILKRVYAENPEKGCADAWESDGVHPARDILDRHQKSMRTTIGACTSG